MAPRADAPPTRPGRGSVERGDHVYIHHPKRGPMTVRVLAHGRDGFTGRDDDGERHAVGWDRMLGHKSRVRLDMKILDRGQEGAIVQDTDGRKRFLAGDIGGETEDREPARAEAPDPLTEGLDRLGKALEAGGPVLFLKAAAAGAAKPASQAEREPPRKPQGQEEPEPERPTMEHGDTVRFRHGDVRGQGTILGSGRDGVTLRDEQGEVHQVRHDALEGPAGDDDDDDDAKPDQRPAAGEEKPAKPGEDKGETKPRPGEKAGRSQEMRKGGWIGRMLVFLRLKAP